MEPNSHQGSPLPPPIFLIIGVKEGNMNSNHLYSFNKYFAFEGKRGKSFFYIIRLNGILIRFISEQHFIELGKDLDPVGGNPDRMEITHWLSENTSLFKLVWILFTLLADLSSIPGKFWNFSLGWWKNILKSPVLLTLHETEVIWLRSCPDKKFFFFFFFFLMDPF